MLTVWMARAVVMLNLAHMRENMLRGRNVMDITGKTALVTGANRGLGRHLAQQLRDRGAKVYAGARNPQSVDLEGVTPIALDITDPTSVATAADATGDVSILINNAGISTGTSLLTGDLATSAWSSTLASSAPSRSSARSRPSWARMRAARSSTSSRACPGSASPRQAPTAPPSRRSGR